MDAKDIYIRKLKKDNKDYEVILEKYLNSNKKCKTAFCHGNGNTKKTKILIEFKNSVH